MVNHVNSTNNFFSDQFYTDRILDVDRCLKNNASGQTRARAFIVMGSGLTNLFKTTLFLPLRILGCVCINPPIKAARAILITNEDLEKFDNETTAFFSLQKVIQNAYRILTITLGILSAFVGLVSPTHHLLIQKGLGHVPAGLLTSFPKDKNKNAQPNPVVPVVDPKLLNPPIIHNLQPQNPPVVRDQQPQNPPVIADQQAQPQLDAAAKAKAEAEVEQKCLKEAFENSLKKAHEKGDKFEVAVEQNKVGLCFKDGLGVEKDDQQAFEWFNKAAAHNDHAKDELGVCYYEGKGVVKNDAQAFVLFSEAKKKGVVNAFNHLGVCYYYGHGVTKDCYKAIRLFNQAKDKGVAEAHNSLGICYKEGQDKDGKGVPQDFAKAFKYFKTAAELGVVDAQFNLGFAYKTGKGCDQDESKGYEWIHKAALKGHEKAILNDK